ncbi:MAG: rhomboid family intramembrane serine protease, partial [Bacteroidota bacterium]
LRYRFTFNPYRLVRNKEWHQFFTSGLIHADHWHLGFNMLVFYYFAFRLEIDHLGPWLFLVMYVGALIISHIPGLIRHKDDSGYNALGASGAISAVVLSMVIFEPNMKLGLLFIPGELPGWLFALLYMAYSFYAGIRGIGRVGHDAHLWGSLAGIVLTVLMKPAAAADFIDWMSAL